MIHSIINGDSVQPIHYPLVLYWTVSG